MEVRCSAARLVRAILKFFPKAQLLNASTKFIAPDG